MKENQDDYQWLEEVEDKKSLEWVSAISDKSTAKIKEHPLFSQIESKALEIYSNKDKISFVWIEEDFVLNLWTDEKNTQGLLRRANLKDYVSESLADWETILDLDLLSAKEKEEWVFHGIEFNDDYSRALVSISRGGSDADEIREFCMVSKEFIPDGFFLPESKGHAHYVTKDTLSVFRIFDNESKTNAGYARTVRLWQRGENLNDAKIIFEGEVQDTSVGSSLKKDTQHDEKYLFLRRGLDFYNNHEFLLDLNTLKIEKLKLPDMCDTYDVLGREIITYLRQDWDKFLSGDLISYNLETKKSYLIFRPSPNQSIDTIRCSQDGIYIILNEDVTGALYKFSKNSDTSSWKQAKLYLPANGSLSSLTTSLTSKDFFICYTSFNSPTTYYYGHDLQIVKILKVSTSFFNHEDIEVKQHFVKSLDGTRIPYFLVHKKSLEFNSKNPTILYGYGGFEVSLTPSFNNALGASWLSKGGVYVLSNIRGGGEYGPKWHQCALKENRHLAYEDFFAIAEDLFTRKITSPEHLGAMGGSNGGLLMGVCYTQRPDLFKAINCQVPLLDMHRYHKLLAGASWVAEYGNPDDEIDGAYIRDLSPYHRIQKNPEIKYPVMYLNTSTKDDRVHPAHARKFCAKLLEYGHEVYYYENMQGGHAGASNFKQSAFNHAMSMCFFWSTLGGL